MSSLPDAMGLMTAIKKGALEAVEASKPVNVYFGEVISVSPLKVNVEQKMVLGSRQLILTRQVTDYSVDVDVDWNVLSDDGTLQTLKGTKKMTVHNALKVGDSVVIARQQCGQKFIIIDRVGVSV